MFNILALDCATKTGWATLVDGVITTGTQDFTKRRGESNGMLFLRFNKWLYDMGAMLPEGETYGVVYYEKAHHRGGAATEIGVGLATRVMEYATSIKAEYMGVATGSLKKFATGSGGASKDDMMDAFTKAVGRAPIDDNEADAYWILRLAMQEVGA